MTALAIILVFFGFTVMLGGSVLLTAAGQLWALPVALVIFFALFIWFGCIPHDSPGDHSSDH